jgi:hypothetical protein
MTTTESTGLLRRCVFALILLGLVAMAADLLLLEHYEDVRQGIPLVCIGLAGAACGWHAVAPGAGSVHALQVSSAILVVAGLAGIYFHYQGNLEFQLDIDPTLSSWEMFVRVMRAKAPPALAPGAMAQLGLLGLAYGWRHPAVRGPGHPIDASMN